MDQLGWRQAPKDCGSRSESCDNPSRREGRPQKRGGHLAKGGRSRETRGGKPEHRGRSNTSIKGLLDRLREVMVGALDKSYLFRLCFCCRYCGAPGVVGSPTMTDSVGLWSRKTDI